MGVGLVRKKNLTIPASGQCLLTEGTVEEPAENQGQFAGKRKETSLVFVRGIHGPYFRLRVWLPKKPGVRGARRARVGVGCLCVPSPAPSRALHTVGAHR